ncbi:MAG TPA: helix-turn-helix domain-containing protein [Bosea sp. (in: a-proteobacteria)]|jgi:lambda repressor-like predicted transcriptional regulator|uniref:helix-turn-helix domain-containing protein n=1 Tax=Bosea sp. (in: a-proteobacteria) TaxID=1871050 RepID=UPI002DDD7AB4|nr:helix-turn-helix domain-containing protein [Bosea sp. (in: a-proteobacteria)]HEV2556850.1 helix-turn-helix domain-containing protein [Bosea sp. (in: a-proteobacteria)]
MHEADIIAAVRKSQFRFLPAIAERYGVSDVALRAALRRPQLGAEKVISKALKIPLHILWPDRWSASGERLVRRGRPRAMKRAA